MATDGLRGHLVAGSRHRSRGEKLAALALLFILLAAAVTGVAGALASQDWGLLLRSALFGLLLGWSLALLGQSAWRAGWITVIFGLSYILLFPGGLAGKALVVLVEAIHLIPEAPVLLKGEPVDLVTLARLSQDFLASAGIILLRLQSWIAALINGQPAFDPVAAALVWNALIWLVAAWAGWVIEARRNALLAALPAVLLSVGTLAYGQRVSFVVYLMLGLLLLLLAVTRQGWREQAWVESGAAYPAKKGRQIIAAAMLATLALVLLSAFSSSISVKRIQEWISEHARSTSQQDKRDLGKSLGIIPGSTAAPDIFETVRNPGLPQDHLIGSGPELSRRVVMTVSVHDPSSPSSAGQPLPLYWRSLAYDIYTGHGWRTSGTESKAYSADQLLQADHAPDHVLIQQDVSPVENSGGTIYAAGEPVTLNLQSEAAWRSSNDLFGVQTDQSSAYHLRSLIPVVDEGSLRAAGQKYPDWVRRRYLALPADIPDRVKSLALELTASEPTPYDRAKAIETYLRTYPYTLDVARPPVNRDVVDYFLFDLKKGYCDYYASAMVVLARAAGVPARLATGYASGTYNLNSKRFIVTEADAHSWVEVYFPDIGWVPFEPTASRPPLEREKPATAVQPVEPAPPTVPLSGKMLPVWPWLLGGAGLAVVLGGFWALFNAIRLRRMKEQAAAVEVYRRMRRYGSSLGLQASLSDTPYEFGTSLMARLQGVMPPNFGSTFLSNLLRDLQALIVGIVDSIYNPLSPEPQQESGVLSQWKKIRWRLGLVWIFNYWETHTGYAGRRWDLKFERAHTGTGQEK